MNELISLSLSEIDDSKFNIKADSTILDLSWTAEKKAALEKDVSLIFEISQAAALEVDGNRIKSGAKISLNKDDKNAPQKYVFSKDLFVVAENTDRRQYHLRLTLTNPTPDPQPVNLNFSVSQLNVKLSESDPTEPTLSGQNTAAGAGKITYSSTNTAVATVDAKTGELTLIKAGQTIIKVVQAATATHSKGESSYTLNITTLTPVNLKFSASQLKVNLSESDPTEPTLSGQNTAAGAGKITYSSTNTAVATVDEKTGELALIKAGQTTIKAVQAATATHSKGEASYTLNITSGKVAVNLSFDFSGSYYYVIIGTKPLLPKLKGAYTGVNAGKITYTSSDPTEIAIDKDNGILTLKKFGIVTITATQAESPYNSAAQATVKLFALKPSRIKSLTLNDVGKNSCTISWSKHNFRGTYFTPSYKVELSDVDGNLIADKTATLPQPTDPSVTKLQHKITGLKPNTVYGITVHAVYGTVLGEPINVTTNTKGDHDMFVYDASAGIISSYTTKYLEDKNPKVLNIPATIDGTTIKKIGKHAFYKNQTITSVTLPNTVTHVGQNAFFGCSKITDITLSNTLQEIAYGAFLETAITKLDNLPSTLTSIGGAAFQNCTNLTTVAIPNSVTEIGGKIFSGCSKLKTVKLSNTMDKIPFFAFSGAGLESFTVPSNIKVIDWAAFHSCWNLKTVTIENGVKKIEISAFEESALQSVSIPASVDSIGGDAFANCNNLASVNLAEGLTYIGKGAFSVCHKLAQITLPNSLRHVDWEAFSQKGIATPILVVKMPNKATPPTIIYFDSSDPDAKSNFYKVKEIQIPAAYESAYRTELNRKYNPPTIITTY